jgi:hypothetical protein
VEIVALNVDGDAMQGVKLMGATEYSHVAAGVSPDCCTVNVWLPTAMVPVRGLGSVFRSIAYSTVPFPLPELPDVTLTQGAPAVAVHAQCAGADTPNRPMSLPSSNDAVVAESSTVQAPRPSCATATFCPAIVSVPLRAASDEFAVTLTLTIPLPVPLAPAVIDIHPRSETAVHEQWLAADTLTEPEPPGAPRDSALVDSVNVQGPGLGEVGESLPQALRPAAAARSTKRRSNEDIRMNCLRPVVGSNNPAIHARWTAG